LRVERSRLKQRKKDAELELRRYGVGIEEDRDARGPPKEKVMKEIARVYRDIEREIEEVKRDVERLEGK